MPEFDANGSAFKRARWAFAMPFANGRFSNAAFPSGRAPN